MVTFAQAQERAERWVNAGVPAPWQRAVRVREFDLGFVAWAEDREDGPTSDGGGARLVVARDGGEMSLWPSLPVGEVIRRFEEEYGGAPAAAPAKPAPRADLEATSFLLTPPEWLQEAADRREQESSPWEAADTSSSGGAAAQEPPQTVLAPPVSGQDGAEREPAAGSEARTEALSAQGSPDAPAGTSGEPADGGVHEAATMLSAPADPAVPPPSPESVPGAPPPPGPPPSAPPPGAAGAGPALPGPGVPPPPGEPGTPGGGAGAPTAAAGGYVPTQMVPAQEVAEAGTQVSSPGAAPDAAPPGDVHHAATMLSGPAAAGAPPPPGPPPAAGAPLPTAPGGPAAPSGSAPPPPPGPPPGGPGAPPAGAAYGFPQAPPPGASPGPVPPGSGGYGYPQASGQPTVGPGYMAVLRYRAPDGSEQQLIRRSAPGTPHPEWQIMHELRGMNVPPQQVLELHTELESCDLPGGYCSRMIRESWPQVRVSHTAAYGRDHASRQQGMHHLVAHQGELHQVADGPARPAPNRVPLPPQHLIAPAPPVPPDGIAFELGQAFGPQGVFRFDQAAVSRQGVPDVVGQILVWAGVPVDVGPFFWGQAQPGRPVPTLAELAQERGVQPGPDAGSYLVMGNDFGRQLCVQYGTAHIVALPLAADGSGQPSPPQFVNTGLPEFLRSLALVGRMWPLRFGLTQEQAGNWTVDFQMQLAALDPAALASPENWWSVLLEQMWDGLF